MSAGPPQTCGARHPMGYVNVGPCEIYGDHLPTIFPHRGIAEGMVEVGFDTREQKPIFARRRWWRTWFDEPREVWPT